MLSSRPKIRRFLPDTSYAELVSWSLRAIPWSITIHIAQKYWDAKKDTRTAKAIAVAAAIAKLLVAFALAPLFILLLCLALLFGLLPIPQLRTLILTTQSVLTSTIGDSLAFVESPVRAALIRTRILEALADLKSRCERTIVVAHSQGAAAVLDALGAMAEPMPENGTAPQEDASHLGPNTLLTFGAGTNPLASLKVVSAGLPERLKFNLSFAMGALLVVGGVSGWLYAKGDTNGTHVLLCLGLLLSLSAFLGGMISAIQFLVGRAGKRWEAVRNHSQGITLGVGLFFFLGAIAAVIAFFVNRGWPFQEVNFLFMGLLSLSGSVAIILSEKLRAYLRTVRKPPALDRWIDLYASADLVPNGPTRTIGENALESVPIWNEGSIFADHTSYWKNLDCFVARVVRSCADTAESSWRSELPPLPPSLDKRAEWRVGWLRLARLVIALSCLAGGIGVWMHHGNKVPLPFALPDWVPVMIMPTLRFGMVIAASLLLAWIIIKLTRFIWRCWLAAEHKSFLNHQGWGNNHFLPLMGMNLLALLTFGLAWLIARDNVMLFLTNPRSWLDAATPIFGIGLISTWVLLRWRPPPQEAAPAATPADKPVTSEALTPS